jgi:hypothetical protein
MPRAATDTQRSCRSQNKPIAARTVGFRQVFGHVSHLVDGLSRTKHWALGAVIAALCSFAYAKVPGIPHGGGGGSYSHADAGHPMRGDARNGGNYYGAANARPAHNNVADSSVRLPHGGANVAAGGYANGFGGYNPGMHRVAGPAGYDNAPNRAPCRGRRLARRFAPARFVPTSPATTRSAVPRAQCSAKGTTRVSRKVRRTVTNRGLKARVECGSTPLPRLTEFPSHTSPNPPFRLSNRFAAVLRAAAFPKAPVNVTFRRHTLLKTLGSSRIPSSNLVVSAATRHPHVI